MSRWIDTGGVHFLSRFRQGIPCSGRIKGGVSTPLPGLSRWINKNNRLEDLMSRQIDKNSSLEASRSRWIDKNSSLRDLVSCWIDRNSGLEASRSRWIDKNSGLEASRSRWIDKTSSSEAPQSATAGSGVASKWYLGTHQTHNFYVIFYLE